MWVIHELLLTSHFCLTLLSDPPPSSAALQDSHSFCSPGLRPQVTYVYTCLDPSHTQTETFPWEQHRGPHDWTDTTFLCSFASHARTGYVCSSLKEGGSLCKRSTCQDKNVATPRFLLPTRCNWSHTRIASSEGEVHPSAFQISPLLLGGCTPP